MIWHYGPNFLIGIIIAGATLQVHPNKIVKSIGRALIASIIVFLILLGSMMLAFHTGYYNPY